MRLQKPRRQLAGGWVSELAGETPGCSIIADTIQAFSSHACGVLRRRLCRRVPCATEPETHVARSETPFGRERVVLQCWIVAGRSLVGSPGSPVGWVRRNVACLQAYRTPRGAGCKLELLWIFHHRRGPTRRWLESTGGVGRRAEHASGPAVAIENLARPGENQNGAAG
jgi:hypothetical protein